MPSSQHDAAENNVCMCVYVAFQSHHNSAEDTSFSITVTWSFTDRQTLKETDCVCAFARNSDRESNRVMRRDHGFPNINKSLMCFVTLAEFTSGR